MSQHNNPAPGQHHNSPPSPHSPSSPSSHTHDQPEKKPGHGTPGSSSGGSHTGGSSGGHTGTGSGSTGSGSPTPTGGQRPALQPPLTPKAIIIDMLENIQDNGLNPHANNGAGGLWINWIYGTSPLKTNLSGSGATDTTRHDALTDLRLVHGIWLYKTTYPGDSQFDNMLAQYTKIVKAEFGTSNHDERGWLYDVLIDIGRLSGDVYFTSLAASQAANFYKQLSSGPGIIYKTDANHPNGFYRVDEAVEGCCAVVQEGARTQHQAMIDAGKKGLQYLFSAAFVPAYGEFFFQVKDVLSAGAVNPSPTIDDTPYTNPKSGKTDVIQGGRIVLGGVAQEAISLLHCYGATKDPDYLSWAQQILDPVTVGNNKLGLWDSTNLGYYAEAVYGGTNAQDATKPAVQVGKKEAGRQMQMLQAFRIALQYVSSSDYQDTETELLKCLLEKAYVPGEHGVVYEMSPTWQLINNENWVTTEAMGIVMEGLMGL